MKESYDNDAFNKDEKVDAYGRAKVDDNWRGVIVKGKARQGEGDVDIEQGNLFPR